MASLKSLRSSPHSIAARSQPIISTPYLSSVPSFRQLDGGVQAGLAAQRGQQRVRALFLDYALDKLGGDGLDIGTIGKTGSVMMVAGLELTR